MTDYSDSYGVYLAILVTAFAAIWYTRSNTKKYRLPPGPRGYPIIGIIPHIMGGCAGERVNALAKKYGKICGGWMGSHFVVFLSDYNIVKETFGRKDDMFSDRPTIAITEILGQLNGVASCTLDNNWRDHRRFTMHVLRNMGMGKSEGKISRQSMENAQDMVRLFRDYKEKPFVPDMPVGMVSCNLASYILFGKTFDYNDPSFHDTIDVIEYVMKNGDAAGIISYFPILKLLPNGGYKTSMDKMRSLEERVQTQIVLEREKTFDPTKPVEDLVDSYLMELHQAKLNNKDTTFSRYQLIRVCSDMLIAATDTTATFMRWLLIFCTKFEHEQRLVHEELDRVVGRDTPVTWKDRNNLPKTMAFVAETMRYSVFGLFAVPHSCVADTKVYNFDIPKDTVLMINMTAILKDPDMFPEPEEFKPSRFIDADNNIIPILIERTQAQFGIGRRVCAGKDVGWSSSFLYIATLLQNFNLVGPDGPDAVDITPISGLTRTPRYFEIIAKAR